MVTQRELKEGVYITDERVLLRIEADARTLGKPPNRRVMVDTEDCVTEEECTVIFRGPTDYKKFRVIDPAARQSEEDQTPLSLAVA